MTLEGIDISTYQATTPSLAGLGFVFDRASYGTSPDMRYAAHAADIRAAGKVLGAYHYWYAADPAQQVAVFLGAARDADLLAIDLEGADSSSDTAHAQVVDMIGRLHAAGRKVGLYHSLSGYPELGQDFDWVAAWGSTPPARAWTFWQYQGAPLDRDRYNGDAGQLAALVAGQGGSMATYALTSQPGTVKVAAGVTAHGIMPGDTAWQQIKAAPGPFLAHVDEVMHRVAGSMLPTLAVHMVDGPLVGLWLGTGGTAIAYAADPAPATYTQAQLDAQLAVQKQADIAAAVAAVQKI